MKEINLTYIIDDDPVVLQINNIILKNHPSFIKTALFDYADDALDEIKEAANKNTTIPDLILLDLNMPIMDGWRFLEGLSEIKKNNQIPVVILTSSIDPRDIISAKKFKNVLDYISKPLDLSKLDSILELMNS
ncbi:MAG: response regulator [Sediminibacterium sp.]|nr:response regulator [Sediminibacterium sp.]